MIKTLIRGGGDLASGVALRLHRAGLPVVITELPHPLVVRRLVSFAEAMFSTTVTVEGVLGRRVETTEAALEVLRAGEIPVLLDPEGRAVAALEAQVVVDARMTKQPPHDLTGAARLVIGLGPGFTAGENCDAVIETNRGHCLSRVYWSGSAQPDTGIPETVGQWGAERVLRSPARGRLQTFVEIGDHLEPDQPVAQVQETVVRAPFRGVLRGLLHPGLDVTPGMKIGDVDPRDDPAYCRLVSDKSLAVGGGVLEAILSRPDLRAEIGRPL